MVKENVIAVTTCLCGELMKKEEVKNGEIPICWKCQCNSQEELERKRKQRKKK